MPQVTIRIEIHKLGLMSFNTMLEGTSKIAYGKKKLVIGVSCVFDLGEFEISVLTRSKPCCTAVPSTQLRVHAGDLSVGDVAAVEERQEIKYREGRDQSEVDFAKDAFRLLRIEDLFLLSCRQ
jgi:hypothetical protein